MSMSTAANLDLHAFKHAIQSLSDSPQRQVIRFLSALKADCTDRKIAWQVYRSVKADAKRMGLI